jgi:uncharacterized protein
MNTYRVRRIVRGQAAGPALVCPGSFSFLGDVDLGTGRIIAAGNPNWGKALQGTVLIYRETKGSSGGVVVLQTLLRKGLAPAAIVTVKPVDYNLAEGAILAQIPFACEPDGDILNQIRSGEPVRLNADAGVLEVVAAPL